MADDDDDEIVTDQTPITHIGMSMRLFHCLDREGIKTLGDLRRWEAKELLRVPNLGIGSLNELLLILNRAGLGLKERPSAEPTPMPFAIRRLIDTNWDFPKVWKRNLSIVNDRLSGMTLEKIGDKYGITKERVRSICNKYQRLITNAIDAKRGPN